MLFFRKSLKRLSQKRAISGQHRPLTRTLRQILFLGLLSSLYSGCAIKRSGYDVPEIPLPTEYKNAPASPVADEAPSPASPASAQQDPGMIEWWRSFGSPELSSLIDRGIANNLDIRIATFKIAQAKARSDQAGAGQYPTFSAPFGESIQAPGGEVGSVPVTSTKNKTTQKLYQASLQGNWRIDLWGEQSALAESATLQVWQAAFERDNVQRNVVGNLTTSYIEYLSANDRLRIAREADEVLSGILTTIQKRLDVGDATIIDLEQQKAAIYAVRSTIPSIEQQREEAINNMALLLGTVPSTLKLSNAGLDSLLLPTVIPSLPSSLIFRRPDVRSMEAKLLASDADVDVARARILPPLDLSTQVGYSSLALSGLFQPVGLFWNAMLNLTISIFDGGKRSSQRDEAQAAQEEMVETYARTIYQAVREVETSLAGIRLTTKRFEAQQEATVAAQRAWDASSEVFAVGGLDYLSLLDSGRTYLRYLDEHERIKMDRYRGYVTLFQALGGGADFGQRIPGKGVRPSPVRGKFAGVAATPQAKEASPVKGVEWAAGDTVLDNSGWKVEGFWQVELPGLYLRSSIAPTWRDLRTRYPTLMEGHIVRPRQNGKVGDSADNRSTWYRLYVAKFPTPLAAHEFCTAMKADYQRCRVTSSTSDETVPPPAQPQGKTTSSTPQDKAAPAPIAAEKPATTQELPARETPRLAGKPIAETPRPESAKIDHGREKQAYTIQLGAFSNLENAAISYAFWHDRNYDAYVWEYKDTEGRTWYAVRTGIYNQRAEALAAATTLRRKEGAPAVMVPTLINANGKPQAVALTELKTPSSRSVVPEPPEASVVVPERKPATTTLTSTPLPTTLAEKKETPKEASAFSVQLGAFSTKENAAVSQYFWANKGHKVFVSEIKDSEGRTWYAVRSGAYPQRHVATASALLFGKNEDAPAIVVKTATDKSGQPITLDIPPPPPATELEKKDNNSTQTEKITQRPPLPAEPASQKPIFKGGKAYTVQLGAYSSIENAAKGFAEWQARGYDVYVCETQDALKRLRFAVRTGLFARPQEASARARQVAVKEKVHAAKVPAILDNLGKLTDIDVSELLKISGVSN